MEQIKANKKNGSRKYYLDIIRIIAIYLVLFTHTGLTGSKLYKLYVGTAEGFVYTMLDCLRTVNNPLLFMVSGALLLGKHETVSRIWKKRISRFAVVLFTASFLQVLIPCILDGTIGSFSIYDTFRRILEAPVRTSYWYLYAYISFLIMLPFLRMTAGKMGLGEGIYLFILGIVMGPGFRILKALFGVNSTNFSVHILQINILYPLIGYVIDSKWTEIRALLGKNGLKILGYVSVAALAVSAAATLSEFRTEGAFSESWITLSAPILSVFMFIVIREYADQIDFTEHERFACILHIVSDSVFGIYLMENLFKWCTGNVFVFLDSFLPTMAACLIWLLVVMAFGTLAVQLIKKIPFFRKYL